MKEPVTFSEGFALTGYIRNKGYMNHKGEIAIDTMFFDGRSFHNGLAIVTMNNTGTQGMIDTTGKFVITPEYGWLDDFSEGLSSANFGGIYRTDLGYVEGGKWGFIDKYNKVIIPFKFNSSYSFSDGMAWIVSAGKIGFINKSGVVIIKPQFDNVENFVQGVAVVNKGYSYNEYTGEKNTGKWGLINKAGKYIIPLEYDEIKRLNDGFYRLKKGNKTGYCNSKGKIIWEPSE
jgi:hypothetical protein